MSFVKSRTKSELINGVEIVELDPFYDERGEIWTLFEQQNWETKFVEDKISVSYKGVIRGLHGDSYISKLISCLSGSLFLSVVDARRDSPTYGAIEEFILNEKSPRLVFVPFGCLNGHQCLTEKCIFWYKWSDNYNGADNQATCRWNDETLKINWPIKNPILSNRDLNGKDFNQIML